MATRLPACATIGEGTSFSRRTHRNLIASGVRLTNISVIAKRISFILFGLCLLGLIVLLVTAYLLGTAFQAGEHSSALLAILIA